MAEAEKTFRTIRLILIEGEEIVYKMGRKAKINDLELIYLYGMKLTHDEIAEKLGVTRSSVTNRLSKLKQESPELLIAKDVQEFRKQETDDLANMRRMILAALKQKLVKTNLSQVSLQQLGAIYGILFDKDRLLRGEATEHIAHATYNQLDDKTRKVIGDAVKQLTDQMMTEARAESSERSGESEPDE